VHGGLYFLSWRGLLHERSVLALCRPPCAFGMETVVCGKVSPGVNPQVSRCLRWELGHGPGATARDTGVLSSRAGLTAMGRRRTGAAYRLPPPRLLRFGLEYVVNVFGSKHVPASCARAAYQALVDAGVTFLDTAEGE